jgi:hypothetical protein
LGRLWELVEGWKMLEGGLIRIGIFCFGVLLDDVC